MLEESALPSVGPSGQLRGRGTRRLWLRPDLPRTPAAPGSGRLPLGPRPSDCPALSAPSATLTMSWRWRKGMRASSTPAATLLAGQPRPGAPAWAAGWAQLRAARVTTAGPRRSLPGVRSARSPSPGARSPLLRAPPGRRLGVLALRAQGRGARPSPSRCGVPRWLLPPPLPRSCARVGLAAAAASADRGLVERPRPAAGAAGGRGEAGGIPLGEFGLPHPARTPGSVRRRRRRGWSTTSRQRSLCLRLWLEEAVAARLAQGLERR